MSNYKLTYYPLTALGEPIRWLLSYGEKEFEDFRFNREDWPNLKPGTPFGQVPVLEIDGKKTWQHAAICRYLARQFKLVGNSDWDAFQIDILVDTFTDFRAKIADYHYDEDPESRERKKQPLLTEVVPYYLSRFEKIVGENGGFFVNNQLTWADLYYVAISDYLEHMVGKCLFEGYPNLEALRQKVWAIPQIKKWMEKRPKNIYS